MEEVGHFVVDIIQHSEELRNRGQSTGIVENTVESEDYYLEELKKVGSVSLFSKTNSWFFGENIPGTQLRFYFTLVTFGLLSYCNRV